MFKMIDTLSQSLHLQKFYLSSKFYKVIALINIGFVPTPQDKNSNCKIIGTRTRRCLTGVI